MSESKPLPFSLVLGVVVPLIGLGLCLYLLYLKDAAPEPDSHPPDTTTTSPATDSGDYQKAVQLFQQGQLPEAGKLLQSAIEHGQETTLSRHLLGIIFGQMGRYDEAIQQFQEIIKTNPRDASAFCNWGEALRRSRRPAEAMIPLEKAVEITPESEVYQFKLRLAQIEAGHGSALAVQAAEEMKKEQPSGDWLMTAAALALSEEKWENAARLLQRAKTTIKPEILNDLFKDQAFHRYADRPELGGIFQQTVVVLTPGPLTQQALQAYTAGEFSKALKILIQAEQAKENPAPLYTIRGASYFSKKDFAHATEAFEKAVATSPQDSTLLLNLGEAQRGNEKSGEASKTFQRALLLSPGNEIYAVKLAFALIETGKAREVLDKGLENAKSGPLLIAKAAAAAKLGDTAQAASHLKQAHETLPEGTFNSLLQDPIFLPFRDQPELKIFFVGLPKT